MLVVPIKAKLCIWTSSGRTTCPKIEFFEIPATPILYNRQLVYLKIQKFSFLVQVCFLRNKLLIALSNHLCTVLKPLKSSCRPVFDKAIIRYPHTRNLHSSLLNISTPLSWIRHPSFESLPQERYWSFGASSTTNNSSGQGLLGSIFWGKTWKVKFIFPRMSKTERRFYPCL